MKNFSPSQYKDAFYLLIEMLNRKDTGKAILKNLKNDPYLTMMMQIMIKRKFIPSK